MLLAIQIKYIVDELIPRLPSVFYVVLKSLDIFSEHYPRWGRNFDGVDPHDPTQLLAVITLINLT